MPPADPGREPAAPRLVEGVDYYVEDGRWVFTAGFLLRRGYCCWNGCRHCPYGNDLPVDRGADPPPPGAPDGDRHL